MSYVIVVANEDGTHYHPSHWSGDASLVVGRSSGADLTISDPGVSRRHCRLETGENNLRVTDLNSRNGTLVNGEAVDSAVLVPGDSFVIGNYQVTIGNPLPDAEGEYEEEDVRKNIVNEAFQRIVNSTLDPGELLRVLLDAIARGIGAWRGFVMLKKEDGDLVCEVSHLSEDAKPFLGKKGRENFPGSVLDQISTSLVEEVMEKGEGMITQNANDDPQLMEHSTVQKLSLKSLLVVPIEHEDRCLGVIYLDNPAAAGQFSNEDLETVVLVARKAAEPLSQSLAHQAKMEELEALKRENRRLRSSDDTEKPFDRIVGASEPMQEVFNAMERVVPTEMNVVLEGETGTGKELVARAIHKNGPRKNKPFKAANCARMDGSLLESELFGHTEGAFTGATGDKKGLFEQADGGTLFLDEIGEMPEDTQAQLLRVIENQNVRPLGGETEIPVDARVICATNRSLDDLMAEGTFREDLFYRLRESRISLPPLSERREDIPLLVDHFLSERAEETGEPEKIINDRVLQALMERSWPGNVRQLRNIVRQLAAFTGDQEEITMDAYREITDMETREASGTDADTARRNTVVRPLDAVEKETIIRALQETEGNKKKAAELLGIHRTTLYGKLEKHDIDPDQLVNSST